MTPTRHRLDLPSGRRLVTSTTRRYALVYDGPGDPRVIRRSDDVALLRRLRSNNPGTNIVIDLTTKEKL
jgi:hypothetical protein